MRALAWTVVAFFALIFAGCPFGGGGEGPTVTPQPTASATAPPVSPTASPTPDPFSNPPRDQIEARGWLQKILSPSLYSPPCPEKLTAAGVGCAQGDATGDGLPELAYLVPVKRSGDTSPHAAAVFIRGGSSQKLEEFELALTADASLLGLAFFQLGDRTGDGLPDLSYIQNICGATGCSSRAVVLSWDGTAWRDVGPGDAVSNVDALKWSGVGAASLLVIHGGKLPADAPAEAGPTRSSTTTYKFLAGRYAIASTEKDPPEYLYHAVEDADEVFDEDLAASESFYRKVIVAKELKDWALKAGDADRRPALVGYALFRVVLIQTAAGNDPMAALDEVINSSKEPLFVFLAEAFRTGYQERGGLVGGCAAVNLYLRTPQAGAADPAVYIAQKFNFGYANPPSRDWVAKMCPF